MSSDATPSSPDTPGHPPPQIPDYEVLRCIGSGSYGTVWLAKGVTGQYRAIKMVWRSSFSDRRPYEREFSGVKKAEPISRAHEGLLDILHVGRNDDAGCFYYVMEIADDLERGQEVDPSCYVARTLAEVLAARPALPFEETLEMGLAIVSALEHLHTNGLIHRDVKPSNIFYVRGRPKLGDVGLVADATDAKSYVGTEGYMPPEGPGTAQADLYSLGKILYEVSTGMDRVDFPALPPQIPGGTGPERMLALHRVIARACHPDPHKRYSNAGELRSDLLQLKKSNTAGTAATKQRTRLLIGVAVVVLAAAVVVGLSRLSRSHESPPARETTPAKTAATPTPAPPAAGPSFGYSEKSGKLFSGCRLEGDSMVFEFDARDHDRDDNLSTSTALFGSLRDVPVQTVNVSGQFNNWALDQWPMEKLDATRFVLRRKLTDFAGRSDWDFKFVVNQRYWVQPPPEADNQRTSGGNIMNLFFRLPPSPSAVARPGFGRAVSGDKFIYGCRIEKDDVVFELDLGDYQTVGSTEGRQELAKVAVTEACVGGVFNNWSQDWPMEKLSASRFVLRKKLSEFTTQPSWQFKFQVNKQYWLELPSDAANVEHDANHNLNLLLQLPSQPVQH